MTTPVERLLHRLELHVHDDDTTSITWRGHAGERAMNLSNRLFGGMVVAQSVVAAGRTYPERHVHSIQQVFLRGGRADIPLDYRVERLFEGRTYATVRVDVQQGEELISQAQVGLTLGIEGPDRSEPVTTETERGRTVNRDEYRHRPNWQDQPVEVRVEADRVDDPTPQLELWLRPNGPLPPDALLHQAVLAYVTDRGFMGVAWKPHGGDGTYRGTSLDHSIWFHRPVRFDDWLVHVIESPTIADGRGLVCGAIIDNAGTRVATTTQQGTFRPA